MARFTASDWTAVDDGWNAIQYKVQVDHPMFFRLRGTNNAMTSSEIDQNSPNGDPALDAQGSTSANAWADLWFYSNPIFVQAGK